MKKYRFRKWLKNWLDRSEVGEQGLAIGSLKVKESDSISGEPLRLNVYSASGGMIIETRTYDRQKDRSNTNLYIINDGADLGNEIGKILTMVSLSR